MTNLISRLPVHLHLLWTNQEGGTKRPMVTPLWEYNQTTYLLHAWKLQPTPLTKHPHTHTEGEFPTVSYISYAYLGGECQTGTSDACLTNVIQPYSSLRITLSPLPSQKLSMRRCGPRDKHDAAVLPQCNSPKGLSISHDINSSLSLHRMWREWRVA